jgi:site-specific recombinase XerD
VKKYQKYPYRKRYPDAEDPQCSWYAFYREGGQNKRVSLATRNERIAEKKFLELCERLDKGVLGFSLRPKKLSFTEFARKYLDEATLELSETSVLRHRQNLFGLKKNSEEEGFAVGEGHLVKFFRTRDFKSIGVKDLSRYIGFRQRAGAASNTILKELATLSAMFQFALAEELVIFNPVLAVKKPKLKKVRPNYTPTREELIRVLESLYPGARRFALAYCNSGCRKSELANCNIEDADLEHRRLRIIGKGGKERIIPVNEVLVQCIKEELASRTRTKPGDPLFLNREGTRYLSLRTPLTRACERAGVPHILHHSLRHAYATLQHEQGLDTPRLSRLLGHANPTVTQNIYIDIFDESLREAAENFEISLPQKVARK